MLFYGGLMRSRLLLISSLIFTSSVALANTQHLTESGLDSKDLITIQPHTRSAAVNAKHAAECAEMGGVDISNSSEMKIGHDVSDAITCKITDMTKYKSYLEHSQRGDAVKQLESQHKLKAGFDVYNVFAPSGYYDKAPYYIGGSAQFHGDNEVRTTAYLGVSGGYGCTGSSASAQMIESHSSGTIELRLTCNTIPSNLPGGFQDSFATACRYSGSYCLDPKTTVTNVIYYPTNPDIKDNMKNLGDSGMPPSCNSPSPLVGDPVNVLALNVYEKEIDIQGSGVYPIQFIRYYNSIYDSFGNSSDFLSGKGWRYNYLGRLLDLNSRQIRLINPDGRQVKFMNNDGNIVPESGELGTLRYSGSEWVYKSAFNEQMIFNSDGKLIRTISDGGLVHNISYNGNVINVSDDFKHSLQITLNATGMPTKVTTNGGQVVTYEYNGANYLIKVTKNGKSKTYDYKSTDPTSLYSITNELGVRYVTWDYRGARHTPYTWYNSGNVNQYTVIGEASKAVEISNPLGRRITYNIKDIDGVRKITSITGNATSLCPLIGSSYEYNDKGLVTLKTDGKGIKTKYEYNDLGQEIANITGYGTAEQKSVTTEWDSRFFDKPKVVTYPDKTITYSYDNNGNVTDVVEKSNN